MAIRISAAAAALAGRALANNVSHEKMVIDLVQASPIELFKPRLPGGVKPTYKAEAKAGLSTGDVIGEFTAENLLDNAYSQIASGKYTGSVKFSKTTGGSVGGTEKLGELAAVTLLVAAHQADDIVTQDWAQRTMKLSEEPVEEPAPAPAPTPKRNRKGSKVTA